MTAFSEACAATGLHGLVTEVLVSRGLLGTWSFRAPGHESRRLLNSLLTAVQNNLLYFTLRVCQHFSDLVLSSDAFALSRSGVSCAE